MRKQNNTNKTSLTIIDPNMYTLKNAIIFGALGGFVASICFAGLILCMSVLFKYPEGAFFDALGILIIKNPNDIVSIGLSSLAIILGQGIIIGIILGIIMSKIRIFYPSNKKKGVTFWFDNWNYFLLNHIFSNGVYFHSLSKYPFQTIVHNDEFYLFIYTRNRTNKFKHNSTSYAYSKYAFVGTFSIFNLWFYNRRNNNLSTFCL